MGNISRATLPQEFFDITTAQLLTQPEPQYLHAQLIKNALNAELDTGGAIGVPIPGRQFGDSGPGYADLEAARLALAVDPIMRDAVKVVVELGKGQVGHTIRINRPKFTNSTYTQASRRVPVGTTIGTTPINVESEQAQITIDRFAGPYDSAASVPAVSPLAIERFDASRGVHSMAAIKEFHLKRDFDRTIDAFGVVLFDQAATTIYPDGMTADNDAATAGAFPMNYGQIVDTHTSLSRAGIPTFSDGKYLMVLHPEQTGQLARDPEFQRLAREHTDFNPLFKASYFRTIDKFHILESSTLTTATNSSSVSVYYGQAFGPGMVGLGAGEMPRTAYHTNDNYGETALVIWLWYAGFSVLDNRFGRSVRSA